MTTATPRVGWALLIAALVLTACANDYLSSSRPLSVPTPTPSFLFIQQEPDSENDGKTPGVDKVQTYMTALATGELMLTNGCLRLKGSDSDIGHLLVWPAGLFTPNIKDNEIQILDRNSQSVAYVGEEVCMSGGEVGPIQLLTEYVQRQIPLQCPGPYWVVGLEVRPDIQPSSDLVTTEPITAATQTFFFVKQKPMLEGRVIQDAPFTGRLTLLDRCPSVTSDDGSFAYTPIWPPDYKVRIQAGGVEVLNGLDQRVARNGEPIHLQGGKILADANSDEYLQLLKNVPCECHPPYWIVR